MTLILRTWHSACSLTEVKCEKRFVATTLFWRPLWISSVLTPQNASVKRKKSLRGFASLMTCSNVFVWRQWKHVKQWLKVTNKQYLNVDYWCCIVSPFGSLRLNCTNLNDYFIAASEWSFFWISFLLPFLLISITNQTNCVLMTVQKMHCWSIRTIIYSSRINAPEGPLDYDALSRYL